MRRRVLRILLATLALAPIVGTADAAMAAPVDLTCTGAIVFHINPGVTLFSQSQQVTGTAALGTSASPLFGCISAVTGTPYTGGSGTFAGSGAFGCVAVGLGGLTGSGHATMQWTWNNGDTSTIEFTLTVGAPLPIVSGTVVAGALAGSTVTSLPLLLTGFTGNCLIAPVTAFSAIGVVNFLKI